MAAQNGGARSIMLSLYVTLPVSAAWLLGYKSSLGTAVMCSSSTLVFAVIEMAGVRLPVSIPGTAIGIWIQTTGAVLMTVIPLAQVLRTVRTSERKYRCLHESTTDAVAAVDMAGNILETNPAFKAMLGYTGEELLRLTYRDLTPERWHAFEARIVAEQVIRLGHSEVYEKEYRRRDGTVFPIELRTYLLRNEANQPVGMWAIVRDITKRQQAAEALRLSEKKFATLFQYCPISVTVSDLNDRDRFIEVNEAFEKYTGYRREEVIGRTYPPDWLWVDHVKYAEAVSQFTRNRKLSDFEFRFRRKGGEVCTGILSAESIEVDGRTCVVATTIDITERKQAEEVRSHLAAIVEFSNDAIIGKTLDGVVVSWNPGAERIYGYKAEEMLGLPISSLIPPDRPNELPPILERLRHGERLEHFETTRVRKDGCRIEVSVTISPIRDSTGAVVGSSVITRDITEQKRAEAMLRQRLDEIAHLNRVAAMGELATSLAHELNQPLAAILLNSQAASRFLSGRPPDLVRVRDCLNAIAADDERAGEIIKRLRGLLKKGESQASFVDLNEVVSDAIWLVGNDALLRQVSFKFEPLPGLPPVLGDRIQLYQVVLNLIMNGLQAAAEQPPGERWVLVRPAEADGGGVELTVEDSGTGISERDLALVFEPFFSTKPQGLGMGLSISRSIVEAHGGRIWAERSAGHGAIFHCTLPVAQQSAAAATR